MSQTKRVTDTLIDDCIDDYSDVQGHFEPRVTAENGIAEALDMLGRDNVDIRDDGCWVWTNMTTQGYGFMMVDENPWTTHRLMASHVFGDIDSECVLHCCGAASSKRDTDRRNCLNPYHLTLGSRKNNTQHSIDRGTFLDVHATLDEDDVKDIRRRYESSDVSQTELGDEYGVAQQTIHKIVNRKTWKHVE